MATSVVQWIDKVLIRGSKSNKPNIKEETLCHTRRTSDAEPEVKPRQSLLLQPRDQRRLETNRARMVATPKPSSSYFGFPKSKVVIVFDHHSPPPQGRKHPHRLNNGKSFSTKSDPTNVKMMIRQRDFIQHKTYLAGGDFSDRRHAVFSRNESANSSKARHRQREYELGSKVRDTTKSKRDVSLRKSSSSSLPSRVTKEMQLSTTIQGSKCDASLNIKQPSKTNLLLKTKDTIAFASNSSMMCTCRYAPVQLDGEQSVSFGCSYRDVDECFSSVGITDISSRLTSPAFSKRFHVEGGDMPVNANKASTHQNCNIVHNANGKISAAKNSLEGKHISFDKDQSIQDTLLRTTKMQKSGAKENLISVDMKRLVHSPRQEKLYVLTRRNDYCRCAKKTRPSSSNLLKPRCFNDNESSLPTMIDLNHDVNAPPFMNKKGTVWLSSKCKASQCDSHISKRAEDRRSFRRPKTQICIRESVRRTGNSGPDVQEVTDVISKVTHKGATVPAIPVVSTEGDKCLRSDVPDHVVCSHATSLKPSLLGSVKKSVSKNERKIEDVPLSHNSGESNHYPSKDKTLHPFTKKGHSDITANNFQEIRPSAQTLSSYIKERELLNNSDLKDSSIRRKSDSDLYGKPPGQSNAINLHHDKKIMLRERGNILENIPVCQTQPLNHKRCVLISRKSGKEKTRQSQTAQGQNFHRKNIRKMQPLFRKRIADNFETFFTGSQELKDGKRNSKQCYSKAKVNAFYMNGPTCSPYGNCYKIQADDLRMNCSWSNSYLPIRADSSFKSYDENHCLHASYKFDSLGDTDQSSVFQYKPTIHLTANQEAMTEGGSMTEEVKKNTTKTSEDVRSIACLVESIQQKKINEKQSQDDSFNTQARNPIVRTIVRPSENCGERLTGKFRSTVSNPCLKLVSLHGLTQKPKASINNHARQIHKFNPVESSLLQTQGKKPFVAGLKHDGSKEHADDKRKVETQECLIFGTKCPVTVQENRGTKQLVANGKPTYTSRYLEGKIASNLSMSWKNTNAVRKHVQLELTDKCRQSMSIMQDINLEGNKATHKNLDCASYRLVKHENYIPCSKLTKGIGGKDILMNGKEKTRKGLSFRSRSEEQNISKTNKQEQKGDFLNKESTQVKKNGSLDLHKCDKTLHQLKSLKRIDSSRNIHPKTDGDVFPNRSKMQSINTSNETTMNENFMELDTGSESRNDFQCREKRLRSIVDKLNVNRVKVGVNIISKKRFYLKKNVPEISSSKQNAFESTDESNKKNKSSQGISTKVLAKSSGGDIGGNLQKLKTGLETLIRRVQTVRRIPQADNVSEAIIVSKHNGHPLSGSTVQKNVLDQPFHTYVKPMLIENNGMTHIPTYHATKVEDFLETNRNNVCDSDRRGWINHGYERQSTNKTLESISVRSSVSVPSQIARVQKEVNRTVSLVRSMNCLVSGQNEISFFLLIEEKKSTYMGKRDWTDVRQHIRRNGKYLLKAFISNTNNNIQTTMLDKTPETYHDEVISHETKADDFCLRHENATENNVRDDRYLADSMLVPMSCVYDSMTSRRFEEEVFTRNIFDSQATIHFRHKSLAQVIGKTVRDNLKLNCSQCILPANSMLRHTPEYEACHGEKDGRDISCMTATGCCQTIDLNNATSNKTADKVHFTNQRSIINNISRSKTRPSEYMLKWKLPLEQNFEKGTNSVRSNAIGQEFPRKGHTVKETISSPSIDVKNQKHQAHLSIVDKNDFVNLDNDYSLENVNEMKMRCVCDKTKIAADKYCCAKSKDTKFMLSSANICRLEGMFLRSVRESLKEIIACKTNREISGGQKYRNIVLTISTNKDEYARENIAINRKSASRHCENNNSNRSHHIICTANVIDQPEYLLDDTKTRHTIDKPMTEQKINGDDDKMDTFSGDDLETLLQCQIDKMKETRFRTSLRDFFRLLEMGRDRAKLSQYTLPNCQHSLAGDLRKTYRNRWVTSTGHHSKKKALCKPCRFGTERERQDMTQIDILRVNRDADLEEQIYQTKCMKYNTSYELINTTSSTRLMAGISDKKLGHILSKEKTLNLVTLFTSSIAPVNGEFHSYQGGSSYSNSCDNLTVSTSESDLLLNEKESPVYSGYAEDPNLTVSSDSEDVSEIVHLDKKNKQIDIYGSFFSCSLHSSSRDTRTPVENVELVNVLQDEVTTDETHLDNQRFESPVICPALPYCTDANLETISPNSSDITLSWANSSVSDEDTTELEMRVIDNNENNATDISPQYDIAKLKSITPHSFLDNSEGRRSVVSCSLAFHTKGEDTSSHFQLNPQPIGFCRSHVADSIYGYLFENDQDTSLHTVSAVESKQTEGKDRRAVCPRT